MNTPNEIRNERLRQLEIRINKLENYCYNNNNKGDRRK